MLACPIREQRLEHGEMPRHRHDSAYISLVLSGKYLERGPWGRWQIEPGNLVCHSAFESHDNRISIGGASIINVPIVSAVSLPPVFTVADPDEIIRAAREGVPILSVLSSVTALTPLCLDWPDELAARLGDEPVSIGAWALQAGFAPATVSRRFLAEYGVSPAQYRLEHQALKAMRMIATTNVPLASIAAQCDFADQAHLSRTIRQISGFTPGALRIKSIQERRRSAGYREQVSPTR